MAIRTPHFLNRVFSWKDRVPYFYRGKSHLDDNFSLIFNKKVSISSSASNNNDDQNINYNSCNTNRNSYDDLDIPDYYNNMINDTFSPTLEKDSDWSTTEDHEITSEDDFKVNPNDIFYRLGTYASDDDTTVSM